MPNSRLWEPIWNTSLKAPHYFDGRVLVAEDLQAEQNTNMARQNWLGKSSGYGVIEGLVASQLDNVRIQITPGLGLNRQGQIISLATTFVFSLVVPVTQNASLDGTGCFTSYKVPGATGSNSISPGPYLLTALPVSHLDGQVPMNGVAGSVTSSVSDLGSRWEVEGLQFKIIPLPFPSEPDSPPVNSTHLQNWLAHWCYGTVALGNLGPDPFNFTDQYSGLDLHTPAVLENFTPSDLPLAVFYWDGSTITFVDKWAARRRITHPDALEDTQPAVYKSTWKALVSDKRLAENQARFLQFQDQLACLVARTQISGDQHLDLTAVQATDFFRFLPPAGFLPITSASMHDLLCADHDGSPFNTVKNVLGAAEQWMDGLVHSPHALLHAASFLYFLLPEGSAGLRIPIIASDLINSPLVSRLVNEVVLRAADDLVRTGVVKKVAQGILNNLEKIGVVNDLGHKEVVNTEWLEHANEEVLRLANEVVRTGALKGAAQKWIEGVTKGRASEVANGAGNNGEAASTEAINTQKGWFARHFRHNKTEPANTEQAARASRIAFEEGARHCVCNLLSKRAATNSDIGANLQHFLGPIPLHINLIGSDKIDALLRHSWTEEAIDLTLLHSQSTVKKISDTQIPHFPMLEIYLVEENVLDPDAQLYVIFHKVSSTSVLFDHYQKL